MIYRFPLRDVKDMLLNQIGNNFFKSIDDERLITKHMERTLERLERNISANDNKYYWRLNAAGSVRHTSILCILAIGCCFCT